MRNHYPSVESLAESDVARLYALDAGELQVRIEYQFTDDHCPCLDVEMNGIQLSLWWLSPYSAAAFYFTGDSPAARAEVVRVIRHQIERAREYADE